MPGAFDEVATAHRATPAPVALARVMARPTVTALIASADIMDDARYGRATEFCRPRPKLPGYRRAVHPSPADVMVG